MPTIIKRGEKPSKPLGIKPPFPCKDSLEVKLAFFSLLKSTSHCIKPQVRYVYVCKTKIYNQIFFYGACKKEAISLLYFPHLLSSPSKYSILSFYVQGIDLSLIHI